MRIEEILNINKHNLNYVEKSCKIFNVLIDRNKKFRIKTI